MARDFFTASKRRVLPAQVGHPNIPLADLVTPAGPVAYAPGSDSGGDPTHSSKSLIRLASLTVFLNISHGLRVLSLVPTSGL